MMRRVPPRSRLRAGFTLVEILVVIVIIAILTAILLPVFSRVKETGYQTNCVANLKDIYLAVSQYKQDTKRYPASIAFLLPKDARLDNSSGVATTGCDSTTVAGVNTCANDGGGDYLKKTLPFVCLDDDTPDLVRSSYGDVSTGLPATRPPLTGGNINRYVWNYWGYDHQGYAYSSPIEAAAASTTPGLVVDTSKSYDLRSNPIASSLSNRNAPPTTIITRCVYHRLPTSKLPSPELLYPDASGTSPDTNATAPTGDAASAFDIVLRLDGHADRVNVGSWQAPTDGSSNWQKQTFQGTP